MPRGSAAAAPLPSAVSLPASSSTSSLASGAWETADPSVPVWAVEAQAGARKANEAALAAAIADSKLAPVGVALKIVHVITKVPCGRKHSPP